MPFEIQIKFSLNEKGDLAIHEKGSLPFPILCQAVFHYMAAKLKVSNLQFGQAQIPRFARTIDTELEKLK